MSVEPMNTTGGIEEDILQALAVLSLEEKVALVRGADFWSTTPIERIGLRRIVFSDGPSGVRGERWDERSPSLSLPCGSAMAASFDVELAYQYGAVCAQEAVRKGVDVVLGPTINLHRSPRGGRHFECLSEDPWLTADMAAAYVKGVQEQGIAATPKHYIANDSETERYTVDVRVCEKTLRELYLIPFESAVKAGAWALMSAYNSVNGVTMSEHDLLTAPLDHEWGFDGAIVSDWTGVRSLKSASAGQDLAMPGPAPAWANLSQAVRDGEIREADLDRKVIRLLRLAARVGAFGTAKRTSTVSGETDIDRDSTNRDLSKTFAVSGMVLLKNESMLPLSPADVKSIAVIGQNAVEGRFQGGGSATVLPNRVVSPLEGIKTSFADAAVQYSQGYNINEGLIPFPVEWLVNPRTGERGLIATFYDEDNNILQQDDRFAARLVWMNGDAPLDTARKLVLRTNLQAPAFARMEMGVGTTLNTRFTVNGQTVFDCAPTKGDRQLGASFAFPPLETATVDLEASNIIEVEFDLQSSRGHFTSAIGITLGYVQMPQDHDALLAEAVETARACEVAVVVVGTNFRHEAEGRDRALLKLPGHQDALVRAVVAANPNTIVIVNAGAPVEMPWRHDVKALLISWFGGQEFGRAIGDILTGEAEPGGRLPTTWPSTLEETPVSEVVPTDGMLTYSEGIHIGYRSWLRAGKTPAYPFGFGLGYTTWELRDLRVARQDDSAVEVCVCVANTGQRSGTQVIQIFAEKKDTVVDRPVRWLVGVKKIYANAQHAIITRLSIETRRFAHWDNGWMLEDGEFTIRAGFCVNDLSMAQTIRLSDTAAAEVAVAKEKRRQTS
ncbi:beta-glucosidase family protein [Rhizobium sp. CFBP 8762]|uniref:beta-glucosidase family protein n=1 Tax=Rhizobium sp. CFBP 8762 TaxID=2775279 RepID=UPI001A7F0E0D|nr:glycoside hydrolase family 3 C-terminal domain-containing protein [Rhizobium sp. CFBP 8762]